MSPIKYLIDELNNIPDHWLLVPTKMKMPLGLSWHNNPYLPNQLQEILAKSSKIKILTKYGWQYIEPTGFGLKCGVNSKEFLIAIDCDGIEAYRQILAIKKGVSIEKFQSIKNANQLIRMAEMYLPNTVSFSSGRMHRKQYLYKAELSLKHELKSRKIHIKNDDYLEFRGNNLASILPPSQHPTGKRYRWAKGNPSIVNVAQAPDWVIEQMKFPNQKTPMKIAPVPKWAIEQFKNLPDKKTAPNYISQQESSTEIEAARNLLEAIHPKYADNYHDWIRIGMALKSISDSLLPEWDRWSQISTKYQYGMCSYKWNTFKNLRCGIRSLYYLAENS